VLVNFFSVCVLVVVVVILDATAVDSNDSSSMDPIIFIIDTSARCSISMGPIIIIRIGLICSCCSRGSSMNIGCYC